MKEMKKILIGCSLFLFLVSAFGIEVSDIKFEGEIQVRQSTANSMMYAWKDVLYVDIEFEAGSNQDYAIRAQDLKKGYSNIELLQVKGNSVKVDPKGKETIFKPGKIFTEENGLVWISFTAPDKKNYKLPTSIKVVPEKVVEEAVVDVVEEKIPDVVYDSKMPALATPSFDELYFVRDENSYPDNGEIECEYVDANKQIAEKKVVTNEQVIIKNVPDGTKPKLFLLDTKEVLVYLAPDLTLRTGGNAYTLFYATRRAGKNEGFSIPKRIMDNPKVNGKLCNIAEFTGTVYNDGGKKKIVLVWTQFTKQVGAASAEELCKTTAIYSCALADEGNMKWELPAIVSEVTGSLQYHPEIYNSGKTLQLCFANRADSDYYSRELNPAFPTKYNYFTYDKSGKWKSTSSSEFVRMNKSYPFTDKNSMIPEDFEYVFDNKTNGVCGVVYSADYVDEDDGETYTNCFAKTYVKAPDTKKLVWTESVPVVYHNKSDAISYPSAVVRPTGEWLVTYLSKTENGNNICLACVNYEPCLVTKTMSPNLDDMEHPNGSMRFTIEVRNEGLAIAEGCDVIVKNELNTEAGKITEKRAIYPGETYMLPSVYLKLKGTDGVVPVEKIKGEAKPLKGIKNSNFAVNKATFTIGIPHLNVGDIFVRTKGLAQTLFFTVGTSNGVKVKAPGVEVVLTEHVDKAGYEDTSEIIPIDYDFSDDYFLVNYAYLTGDIPVDVFEVMPHVHFATNSKHLPQYTKEEIEEMTSCSSHLSIYNPLLTKSSVRGGITSTSYNKKTKVMQAEFVVMNEWPEFVEGEAALELYNLHTGGIEQTLTIPFSLEVMKAQKIKCEFDPIIAELEAEYTVNLVFQSLEDNYVSAAPEAEPNAKAEETSENPEPELSVSVEEVESVEAVEAEEIEELEEQG